MVILESISSRLVNLTVFAGCVMMMAVALYFQHVMGLEPCILCITQRVMVISIGAIALVAAIHNPGATGVKVYGAATVVAALGGAAIAIRQLWLQSLPPDQVPACGPSLEYILDVFPLAEALEMILLGDGNCAEVLWTLFGISIPGWTLVAFVGLTVIGVFQFVRPRA